jgi:hypothetical protein
MFLSWRRRRHLPNVLVNLVLLAVACRNHLRKIKMTYALEPTMLGGIRMQVGSTVRDGTVRKAIPLNMLYLGWASS